MGKNLLKGSIGSLTSEMKRPLRILQVSHGDQGGGAQYSAWHLYRSYYSQGHKSWLAVGHKRSDDPNVFIIPNDRCRSLWVKAWLASSTFLGPKEFPFKSKLLKLTKLISEPQRFFDNQRGYEDIDFPGTWCLLELTPEMPDIVHCHNLHGNYFDVRALSWLSEHVPIILNLRDAWLLGGHCAHSFDCERWKIGCGKCPDLTIPPAIPRDATAYNWKRKQDIYGKSRLYITTPSRWLMDKVKQSLLTGVKYKVIPNAVDLAIFHPGKKQEARKILGLPIEAKIVLLISHNPFKDYSTMEDALCLLDNCKEGKQLLFVCIGKEDSDRHLGNGHIRYVGFVHNQKRLVLYYQAADVFIHAAKAETFGKTIIEAFACGVPVVATAVGGIPELIEEGTNGYLVPPRNAKAMAARLAKILNDETEHDRLSKQAVRTACARFDLNRQVDDFLEWYHEIFNDWAESNNKTHTRNV